MLFERIILGILMIAALVGVVVLDMWLSLGTPNRLTPGMASTSAVGVGSCGVPVLVVAAFLTLMATYELGRILRIGDYQPATLWAAFVNVGLVFLPWIELRRLMDSDASRLFMAEITRSITSLWLV